MSMRLLNPDVLSWNDGVVMKLAVSILENSDWGVLPILADAVEEAGCTNASLLGYLRMADMQAMYSQLDWYRAYQLLKDLPHGWQFQLVCLLSLSQPDRWTIPILAVEKPCSQAIAALRESGVNVWSYYDDIDREATINDPDANRDGNYAIAVKAAVEADGENRNQSADMLAAKGHKGITVAERLFLELAYFLTTGKHLDIKNVTLCTGSRSRSGDVPRVYWDPGNRRVYVDWYHSGNRAGYLRSRSAVVLPAEERESVPEQA